MALDDNDIPASLMTVDKASDCMIVHFIAGRSVKLTCGQLAQYSSGLYTYRVSATGRIFKPDEERYYKIFVGCRIAIVQLDWRKSTM